jgi:Resolvase, N terminal domain
MRKRNRRHPGEHLRFLPRRKFAAHDVLENRRPFNVPGNELVCAIEAEVFKPRELVQGRYLLIWPPHAHCGQKTPIRVSTSGQGRSGLGIEAQRQTLAHFAASEGYEVTREFVEVETGKGSDALDRRPQLKAALAAARKLRCHVAEAT